MTPADETGDTRPAPGSPQAFAVAAVRPRIVITVGLPGCGKSTYLGNLRIAPLSSDTIRELLADDVTNQAHNRRVFQVIRYLLFQRLEMRMPVTYIDATHLNARERRPYVRIAELYGADVEVLYFDVPLAVCQERNRARNRIVADEVMERFAAKLSPPLMEEGFSKVMVVRE
jgi:predicted kinase